MNKLATIEKIHSISVHDNADSLSVAKIMGFDVVIKKDQFKENDLVVFIWPDTVMKPAPWNDFLNKDKESGKPIRVKSVKLRGRFSTGVVLPISVLKEIDLESTLVNYNEGDEVSELLSVFKYEKDTEVAGNGESAGNFPSFIISRTDEDLAQSKNKTENEFRGLECYLSYKIDGQSCTIIFQKENPIVRVCSRNNELKSGMGRFWDTIRNLEIDKKLIELNTDIAIQNEHYGESIQKNKLGIKGRRMAIFTIKNLVTGNILGLHEMIRFCETNGFEMVPVFQVFKFDETWNFDKIQELADNVKYPNGVAGEGLVLRPVHPIFSPVLQKYLSVKFINRNYKD